MNKVSTSLSELDARLLDAAIRLGRKNLGLTAPNPSVGAIVAKDFGAGPVVLGQGVTAPGGRPHAEPQAIEDAGEQANGATLYVSLEPCAHQGMTPPCVDAIIGAGIRRVVCAVQDNNPKVAGKSFQKLREANIELLVSSIGSFCAKESVVSNLGHFVKASDHRPAVTLKIAETEDGFVGSRSVANMPITTTLSRRLVHMQRAEHDCVMVGSGTVQVDDPQLTCRLDGLEDRSPARVVLSAGANLSLNSLLVKSAFDLPVWVVVGERVNPMRVISLEACGCNILMVSEDDAGRLDLHEALAALGNEGFGSIYAEGGPIVAHSLLLAGLVDRFFWFQSQRRLKNGVKSPITDDVLEDFDLMDRRRVGSDRLLTYIRKGL